MAITVPTIGSEIDVVTFGKPVVDAVNRIGVHARRSSSLVCPNGLQTPVTWPTELSDPSGLLAADGTFTMNADGAGVWLLTCTLQFASVTSNTARTSLICDVAGQTFGIPILLEVRGIMTFSLPMVAGNTAKYSLYTESPGVTIAFSDFVATRVSI